MANFYDFFPTLLKEEGGFTNNPDDKGGATNLGITLYTWEKSGWDKDGDHDIDVDDLKSITSQDAAIIYKRLYWDRIQGDNINSQSVATLLFDFAVNSGISKAVKVIQSILSLTPDGILGQKTISLINQSNAKNLFDILKIKREQYYRSIVQNNPSQSVFLNGWLNRLSKFQFSQ